MAFTALMAVGWGIGLTIGALSHPKVYRAVFGGGHASNDYDGVA
jgi:hypothetical protein